MEVLQSGRQLSYNLIETIQQEFAQLHPQQPPPQLHITQQQGKMQLSFTGFDAQVAQSN